MSFGGSYSVCLHVSPPYSGMTNQPPNQPPSRRPRQNRQRPPRDRNGGTQSPRQQRRRPAGPMQQGRTATLTATAPQGSPRNQDTRPNSRTPSARSSASARSWTSTTAAGKKERVLPGIPNLDHENCAAIALSTALRETLPQFSLEMGRGPPSAIPSIERPCGPPCQAASERNSP